MVRVFFGLTLIAAFIGGIVSIENSAGIFMDLLSAVFVVGMVVCGAVISLPIESLADALIPGRATTQEAKARKVAVFHRLADLAVSSGLCGTLVGLVLMLTNLDDPTAIGPAMAVALLTMLYGVVLGEVVFRGVASSTSVSMDASPDLKGRRGAVSIYMPFMGMFVMVCAFFLMLLAMG